jgi:hypothetical protein
MMNARKGFATLRIPGVKVARRHGQRSTLARSLPSLREIAR